MKLDGDSILSGVNLGEALRDSLRKCAPSVQLRKPVMFAVYLGAWAVTLLWGLTLIQVQTAEPEWFVRSVMIWMWITVIFANFAEALAEGRGRAQADSLRSLKRDIKAKKLTEKADRSSYRMVAASTLRRDDLVLVEAGDFIPGDGQVVEGIASIDESAITGESAPVIRESDGDRDAVTGGTRVLSDWLVIRIMTNPGESFIDQMVLLVEGARRHKTPNELALNVFLVAQTILFLAATATLLPFSHYSVNAQATGEVIGPTVLIALFVCLAPTTIGGLLSAIGIAGMNRLLKANVIATSGRAVEAAGDVGVLLLDKTGTITYGNRQAEELAPAMGVSVIELAKAAHFSSLADQTPEGRSIAQIVQQRYNIQGDPPEIAAAEFIEFSAETRVSGVLIGGRRILKGAADAIEAHLKKNGGSIPDDVTKIVEDIARRGGTPLVVADNNRVLGVIHLKDVVKQGIRQRLAELRRMGIKSVMITGDNPLTAVEIAAEVGVDDFLAQATPEAKLKLIRKMQSEGQLVAMVGDGTNDAPALAQSDVAVVMNSGTQAAKEAGNMIDLDSDPTKLIEIVEIGKQLLMTRGSLTTFSFANDLAKYFAIIPAAFISTYPELEVLNIMGLASPLDALLAAVIFNALIIIGMIPVTLRGVTYRAISAEGLLKRNLLLYGLGGIIVPFIGIKVIDVLLVILTSGGA